MVQPIDDDERTNSMGLFNTAEAFSLSATALARPKVTHGHAHMVRRFLYYHALELYLKALLRQKHSNETLTKRFRHNMKRLVKEAEVLGLTVMDDDRDVFTLMSDTDAVIEARYIRTGSKTWPTLEELSRTCNRIPASFAKVACRYGYDWKYRFSERLLRLSRFLAWTFTER